MATVVVPRRGDCIQQLVNRLLCVTTTKDDNTGNARSFSSNADVSDDGHAEQQWKATPSYLILVQHSQTFALRRDQQRAHTDRHPVKSKISALHRMQLNDTNSSSAQEKDDDAVYRRAGLVTPSEAASLDWQSGASGMEHIATAVLQYPTTRSDDPSASDRTTGASTAVLWVGTLPHRNGPGPAWLRNLQASQGVDRVHILDLCRCDRGGPFGWDTTTTDETSPSSGGGASMEDLNTVLSAIRGAIEALTLSSSTARTINAVVMVESLSPILVRHGWTKARQFVQRLASINGDNSTDIRGKVPFIVLSTALETCSYQQHVAMEDMANAVLRFQQGKVELVRQSVRERRNAPMVRDAMAYTIHVESTGSTPSGLKKNHQQHSTNSTRIIIQHRRLQCLSATGRNDSERDTPGNVVASTNNPLDETRAEAPDLGVSKLKRGPSLLLHEGSRETGLTETPTRMVAQPNIYMQDDDPEFDDFDEEDPDDDLDL